MLCPCFVLVTNRAVRQDQKDSRAMLVYVYSYTCDAHRQCSLTVLVAVERSVKIWDAVSGTLLRVFKNVTEADITVACLDDRERKVLMTT